MSRNPVLIRTLGAVGIAALLTTAACGSDESGTADAVPTAAASVTAAAAAATAPAQLAGCAVSELRLTLGQGQGAAGSTELPLVFTNVGGRTCALDGFPGVSYVQGGADGAQVGAAATRSGESAGAVPLAPDATATAMVRAVEVQNYPADTCAPTPVAGLRVYPPNDTGSIFVPYATTGCSKTGDGLNQLSVQAVTG
ncbi:DUF4232 domain-containing protein [Rhodococcus hoagii]|jgi:hypothetical protein|uniref:Secreted protein n=1 Tax=Rhodococcus hoagii (strain 103S) TaxID=685727 RepID=A0A3S5Y554_RHOH1|nr:DUF4232 domain-containing protein [Prescottella equi]MDP8016143.1 DUF4232 domain-containing protein [Prescottella equi]NKR85837.1 DUF4232 domain-containing protein [Prescottella equi]NKS06018.1 DUF4232 domain-containing protein [Prescottella equi]NKS92684.1 DUF4232 domain-containing protein [Prescottella equi]NKS94851.1 DUF4232 domain-containing protein [Prescottella equi]